MKEVWKAGNMVAPAPAALVSCRRGDERPNLITVAWCGNVNSDPPMLSVSIRPSRHSHAIIEETGEFVVNIPSVDQGRAVDYCGVVSGRDVDKFAETGLTPLAMAAVACPGVEECPVNIACRVERTVPLGSHVMFLATVLEVAADSRLMDGKGGFKLERAGVLCYAHGHYFGLGKRLGHFGWSVRKKPVRKGRR